MAGIPMPNRGSAALLANAMAQANAAPTEGMQDTQGLLNNAYADVQQNNPELPQSLKQPLVPHGIPTSSSIAVGGVAGPAAPSGAGTMEESEIDKDNSVSLNDLWGSQEVPAEEAPKPKPGAFGAFFPTLMNNLGMGALKTAEGAARFATEPFLHASPAERDATEQAKKNGTYLASKDPETVRTWIKQIVDAPFEAGLNYLQKAQQSWDGSVGWASQLIGSTVGNLAPAVAASLALKKPLGLSAAGTAGLGAATFAGTDVENTARDVQNQTNDPWSAFALASFHALADYTMTKFPTGGNTYIARFLKNAGINIAVNTATEGASKAALNALGHQKQAQDIHPLDGTASAIMLAAIFAFFHEHQPAQAKAAAGAKPGAGTPPPAGAQPGAPPPPAGAAPPVPDHASPEPIPDIAAQLADMKDPKTPRQAVFIPQSVTSDPAQYSAVHPLIKGMVAVQVPDKGLLVFPDKAKSDAAAKKMTEGLTGIQSDAEYEQALQRMIGEFTGAGTGKDPNQTLVVQGQTPKGAVATESAVTPQEVPGKVQEVKEQGKQPVVTTPDAALDRREQEIAGQSREAIGTAKIDGVETPVKIVGEASVGGNRQLQIRPIGPNGEIGEAKWVRESDVTQMASEAPKKGKGKKQPAETAAPAPAPTVEPAKPVEEAKPTTAPEKPAAPLESKLTEMVAGKPEPRPWTHPTEPATHPSEMQEEDVRRELEESQREHTQHGESMSQEETDYRKKREQELWDNLNQRKTRQQEEALERQEAEKAAQSKARAEANKGKEGYTIPESEITKLWRIHQRKKPGNRMLPVLVAAREKNIHIQENKRSQFREFVKNYVAEHGIESAREPGQAPTVSDQLKARAAAQKAPPPETKAEAPAVAPEHKTLSDQLTQLEKDETPPEGKSYAGNVAARAERTANFATVLKDAVSKAAGKVPDALIDRANKIINRALKLGNPKDLDPKTGDIARGKGDFTHPRITAVVNELSKVARTLMGQAREGDEVSESTVAAGFKAKRERARAAAEAPPKAEPTEENKERTAAANAVPVKGHQLRNYVVSLLGKTPEEVKAEAVARGEPERGALARAVEKAERERDAQEEQQAPGYMQRALDVMGQLHKPVAQEVRRLFQKFKTADEEHLAAVRQELISFVMGLKTAKGKELDAEDITALDRAAARGRTAHQAERTRELEDREDRGLGEEEDDSDESYAGMAASPKSKRSGELASVGQAVHDELNRERVASIYAERSRAREAGEDLAEEDEYLPKQLHGILDSIIARLKDPVVLKLVNAVRSRVPNIPVQIKALITEGIADARAQYASFRSPLQATPHEGSFIEILAGVHNPQQDHFITDILHEATHAATYYLMNERPDDPTVKKIVQLFQEARRRTELGLGRKLTDKDTYAGRLYGLSEPHEFVTELMSNPEFRQHLNSLDGFMGMKGRVGQMLNRFYGLVSRLLGIEPFSKEGRFLRESVLATQDVMDRQNSLRLDHPPDPRSLAPLTRVWINRHFTPDNRPRFDKYAWAEESDASHWATRITASDQFRNARLNGLLDKYFDDEGYFKDPGLGEEMSDEEARDLRMALGRKLNQMDGETDTQNVHDLRAWRPMRRLLTAYASMRYSKYWDMDRNTDPYFDATKGDPVFAAITASPPPPLRNEARNLQDAPREVIPTVRRFSRAATSRLFDAASKGVNAWSSFDQVIRRVAHSFGDQFDHLNPARQYQSVRALRQSFINKAVQASQAVVHDWRKLPSDVAHDLGAFMRDSTTWGVDPNVLPDKHTWLSKNQKRDFANRYSTMYVRWRELPQEAKDIYNRAMDATRDMARNVRVAAVESVLKSFGQETLPSAHKTLFYAASKSQIDQLVARLMPNLDAKTAPRMARAMKDVAGFSEMEGPYFHLGRTGNKVVQVTPKGEKVFQGATAKADAESFRRTVHELGPTSRANKTVDNKDGTYTVKYKAYYVSMHRSEAEANEAAENMRNLGFEVRAVTERQLSKETTPLSAGLKYLMATMQGRLERAAGVGGGNKQMLRNTEAMMDITRNTFNQLLASRSAYAASKLARRGVGGVNPDEMMMNFARHAASSAYQIGHLRTVLDEATALGKMQEAARDTHTGNPSQRTLIDRGRAVHEIGRRVVQEASQLDVHGDVMNATLAKLGFANFLASPAHAMIWTTQNITTGIPVAGARYGYWKAWRAFSKGTFSPMIPAMRATMQEVWGKKLGVTSDDITGAVMKALEKDPQLSKYKSHFQELMDTGVIGSGLSNHLGTIGRGLQWGKTLDTTMELMRIMPHLADMYNRISTAIAGLELTKGDVTKTADLIREVHVDYSPENASRVFKAIKRFPGGNTVTMMKSYAQGMSHLLMSNMYDALIGSGVKSRGEAAKTLAGMFVGTSIFAGLVGAPMLGWLMYGWNHLFGDSDEYKDVNNQIRRWSSDVFGQGAGEMVASGLPRALGVDLSERMGMSSLFFHNAPDLLNPGSMRDKLKDMIWSVAGTFPEFLGDGVDNFRRHMERGQPVQALTEMVPVKALKDAVRAYGMATSGVYNRSGSQVTSPEDTSTWDSLVQFTGFKPEPVANMQERRATATGYRNWAEARKAQIVSLYAQDPSSGMEALSDWNAANPGDRITRSDLFKERAQMMRQYQLQGQGRNPTLNAILGY